MVYLRWGLVTGFRRSWDSGRLIVRLTDVPSEAKAEEELGGRTAEVSVGRVGLLGLWGLDPGSETSGFGTKLTDFGRLLLVEAAGFGLSLWGMMEVGLTGGGATGEDRGGLSFIVAWLRWRMTALLSETRSFRCWVSLRTMSSFSWGLNGSSSNFFRSSVVAVPWE